ncbi:MAG: sulfatase [Planctomycetes bacterium]|nr:sulfatase [Planctomycetota bacterium]
MRLLASLRFVLSLLLAGGAAVAQSPTAPRGLAGSRPNILFVFSDDHACQAIGAYGSTFGATPNLDRLAGDGVVFTANYCGNALCGPSRASILTGLHSHANGFCRNGNVFDGGQATFPKLLQQAGYQTAIVGKWHLDSAPTGFDYWEVLPDQGQYYNPDFLTAAGRVRREGHATDVTTALAIAWLERRDPARPFVLMCQHKAPHRNWLPAPKEYGLFRDGDLPAPATLFDDHAGRIPARARTEMEIARHLTLHYDLMVPPTAAEAAALAGEDRAYPGHRARMSEAQRAAWDAAYGAEDEAFRRLDPQGPDRVRWLHQRYLKNYLRCVAGVDRSIGELRAWLDAHPEVKANTLVIYASDQGFFLGEHGYYDKRWMDEECFRMPLLMAWPGRLEGGRRIEPLTQNIDFAPTFVELAGAKPLAAAHGVSLVPLLEGRQVPWRDAVYYHYYESQSTHRVPAMYGVRTERWKLVRYYEPHEDAWELFDLQQDPDERRSLAGVAEFAAVQQELTQRLRALRQQYGDDTGELLGEVFPRSAGVTRIVREGDGFRVWANTVGGYALQPGASRTRLSATTAMRSLPGKLQRQGFVVFADDDGPQLRVGFEFGARKLVVQGHDGSQRAEVPIEWDGAAELSLRVELDAAAHTLVAVGGGQRLSVALATSWRQWTQWGYGGSNTETWFGPLRLE